MINNSKYCQKHLDHLIRGICIAKYNQKYQQMICEKCIIEYQIPAGQIISIEDFQKQIFEKSYNLRMNNQLKQHDYQSQLKKVLQQFDEYEVEIAMIQKNMKESINNISNTYKTGDEIFQMLNKQDFNLLQCTQNELGNLVNFLQENIFETWVKRKQIVSTEIQKGEEALESAIKKCTLHVICLTKFRVIQFSTNQEKRETIVQMKGFSKFKNKFKLTDFNITTNLNGDKIYKQKQQILRREKIISGQKDETKFDNLEQIKHLDFKGQYGINGFKIKLWNYFWKGKKVGGGSYNLFGKKVGKWSDLCENYWDEKNIIEEGYYKENNRVGNWTFKWNNRQIGGGQYDQNGEGTKIGNWMELSHNFNCRHQVFDNGEYLNNKKVGKWDIKYKNPVENYFKPIGGGSYDNGINEIKIGNWIELSPHFKENFQIIYTGLYQNGRKVGKWEIKYKYQNEKQFKPIGGGSYDNGGDEIKIGKWIEINEYFKQNSQIIYIGQYKNGIKIGKWDIKYKNQDEEQFKSIGGGTYDIGIEEKKVGQWIELCKRFNWDSQIIFIGQYLNGRKAGRWDIQYKKGECKTFQIIGGGQFFLHQLKVLHLTKIRISVIRLNIQRQN
ncbi:unnamed protein product [Paramecium pentaurelia]|uniref:Uncharacterized protein n=1 Tax=Paramecium pentaurelia TaxID=43138 RepID=A0A8S1YID4_9CILI|nr:unnamed protein product [Paramecium pentaurelia]